MMEGVDPNFWSLYYSEGENEPKYDPERGLTVAISFSRQKTSQTELRRTSIAQRKIAKNEDH